MDSRSSPDGLLILPLCQSWLTEAMQLLMVLQRRHREHQHERTFLFLYGLGRSGVVFSRWNKDWSRVGQWRHVFVVVSC